MDTIIKDNPPKWMTARDHVDSMRARRDGQFSDYLEFGFSRTGHGASKSLAEWKYFHRIWKDASKRMLEIGMLYEWKLVRDVLRQCYFSTKRSPFYVYVTAQEYKALSAASRMEYFDPESPTYLHPLRNTYSDEGEQQDYNYIQSYHKFLHMRQRGTMMMYLGDDALALGPPDSNVWKLRREKRHG